MQLNTVQTKKALRQLKSRYPKAVARALNRSNGSAKTVMVRSISKDMGLKQAIVRKDMVESKATPTKLSTRLEVSGARIPLIHFSAKGPYPSRGQGKGVSYRLPGGRKRHPNAFIARMRSGKEGVFVRKHAARLPIAELHGPSLPHVFRKFEHLGLARGLEQLDKNLAHELRWAISQAATA